MKPVKLLVMFSLAAGISLNCKAQSGYINTIAGNGQSGFSGDGGPAISASLNYNCGVWVDNVGNTYISDQSNHRIRKVSPSGIITTIAGNGSSFYSGDGGPATAAGLTLVEGSGATDNAGNVYIPDRDCDRVRKIDGNGIITTFAGNGQNGYGGDGGQASASQLSGPIGVACDLWGNVYIADAGNRRVRKVDPTGVITTIAGNGQGGYGGDGGPATQANIGPPKSIAVDNNGNVYIGDFQNNRIRRVDANGIITTFAGNGIAGYAGDGGPATQAQIGNHWGGVGTDNIGNVYIADRYNHRVRKVDYFGIITTIAGTGIPNYSGDGGPAVNAELDGPVSICVDINGDVVFSDQGNHVIRKIGGIVTYIADSFSVYISKTCAGPNFTVTKSYYTPGMEVHTHFGDGAIDTSVILSSYNGGYAYLSHVYPNSGSYHVQQYLYNGTNIIDSMAFTYEHKFCATMSVRLYYDANSNCIYDSGVDASAFLPTQIQVDSVNTPIDTISCTSGFTYTAFGNAGDVYHFKVISLPGNIITTCPVTGIISDVLQPGINATNYIGLGCSTSNDFDLRLNIDSRAGSHAFEAYITPENQYCAAQNAVLTMTFDPSYTFFNSTSPPATQGPGFATWYVNGLSAALQAQTIYVNLDGAQWATGTPVSTTYTISPTTGDVNPGDNTVIIIDTVTGGWDPNAIYVKPAGCVPAGTNLEYTITFENLGNGPAENIFVLDTLPAGLDASSMRLKFASHNMYVEKIYNGEQVIFKFDFPNIMLPDSSDPGRHGMLVYTIDTKNTLPFGANIQHDASIYFDFNPPVVTNTSQTGICWPAKVSTTKTSQDNILLYPNPADDILTIKTEKQYASFTISNSIGQVVLQQALNSKESKVNIKSLSPGIYYISLKGESGTVVRKFAKL